MNHASLDSRNTWKIGSGRADTVNTHKHYHPNKYMLHHLLCMQSSASKNSKPSMVTIVTKTPQTHSVCTPVLIGESLAIQARPINTQDVACNGLLKC